VSRVLTDYISLHSCSNKIIKLVKAGTKKDFGEGTVTVCKIGMPDILAKRKLPSSARM